MKTIYFLRTRLTDDCPWGDPECFRKKADRDYEERFARIMFGIRTHSYSKKLTSEEIDNLCLK